MPADTAFDILSAALPRILVVSRRSVRKNKFIDFVGEYHLDLLVRYGSCPIIVPRVENVSKILDAFEPIHGVLLAEGEDISTAFRPETPTAPSDVLTAIRDAHPGDAQPDVEKDSIEFELVRRCLDRGIPLFGICRGSQIINVVSGGSLLLDIETELAGACTHIDYANYDDHRHPISVKACTPLSAWFDEAGELSVNSYHHQGINCLASRFVPMALSPDGLVEGFYDPHYYNPEEGKFLIGLQFHPERMQNTDKALQGEKNTYDYPGCPRPYEAFVRAATAFRARSSSSAEIMKPDFVTTADIRRVACGNPNSVPSAAAVATMSAKSTVPTMFEHPSEQVRKEHEGVLKSFSLASKMYHQDAKKRDMNSVSGILSKGAAFLEATAPLYDYSKEDLNRLYRSGATVHGRRFAYNLLKEKTNFSEGNTEANTENNTSQGKASLSDWRRFHKGILQAERSLESLRGTARMEEAVSLIRKLSELTSVQ